MAHYEAQAERVGADLTSSDDIAPATKAAILRILEESQDEDGNIVVSEIDDLEEFDHSEEDSVVAASVHTSLLAEADGPVVDNIPILLLSGDDDTNLRLEGSEDSDRVVIAGEGSDTIVIAGGHATVEGGAGNDSITGSAGNDSIVGGFGDDSITGGAGGDTIVAGGGNDSVDGGAGIDLVRFASQVDMDDVTVDNGVVTVRDADGSTSVRNVEFIQLADGEAVINAADRGDATAARLVSSTVGEYGFDEYKSAFDQEDPAGNIDLAAFASGLLEQTDLGDLGDREFIEALYRGTFDREVDEAGLEFYLNALEMGDKTRAEIFADLGWSDEGVESFGSVNTIDGMV